MEKLGRMTASCEVKQVNVLKGRLFKTVVLVGLAFIIVMISIAIPIYETGHGTGWSSIELACSDLRGISFDHKGHTWMGCNGVAVYDGNALEYYHSNNSSILWPSGAAIAIDSSGHPWVGAPDGISIFDDRVWTNYTKANSDFSGSYVKTIAFDDMGQAWVGCADIDGDGGVHVFDGEIWVTYSPENSGLVDRSVTSIAFDDSYRAWIGTEGGISVFDGKVWTNYTEENSGLINNQVYEIAFDRQGQAWIATAGGLNVFDGRTWGSYTQANSGFDANFVMAVTVDDEDNVWTAVMDDPWGNSGYGVYVYDGGNWTNYNTENSRITSNLVNAIAFDQDGRAWIGTQGGSISILEPKLHQAIPPRLAALRHYLFSLHSGWIVVVFLLGLWLAIALNALPGWLISFAVAGLSFTFFGLHPKDLSIEDLDILSYFLSINYGVVVSLGGLIGTVGGGVIDKIRGKRGFFGLGWNGLLAILCMIFFAVFVKLVEFLILALIMAISIG